MSKHRAGGWHIPAVACAAVLASIPAHAVIYCYCSGTLHAVIMYSSGDVTIQGSWRGDYTTVCNTQGGFGGIDGTICLAWYAAAVKALADQTTVYIQYPNDGGYSCSNLPTYNNALVPGYFLVMK